MVLAELLIGAAWLLAQGDMSRREHFVATNCKKSRYPLSATPFGPNQPPKPEPSAAHHAVAAAAAAAAANQSTHPPIALSREPTLAAQSTHAPHAARSGDLVRPAEL